MKMNNVNRQQPINVTSTPEQSISNKPVNQKGNIIIIIAIVFLLIIGGVGAYFYTLQKRDTSSSLNSNQQKTVEIAKPSPQVTQTSNLKTYTDSTYQYSFQYPDTWFVDESTQQFQTWDRVVDIFSSTDTSKMPDVTGTINIWKPSVAGKRLDIQSFLEKPPAGGFKQTTVGSYKAYRVDEVKEGKTNITLFFEKDSRIFQLTFVISDGSQKVANIAIVEGIIKSLKFI